MLQGQDWSSYQSNAPSTSGLSFVFVKATEGTTYTSPSQAAQAAHARSAGCVVGFYAFLRPGDMKAQAAYFVQQCASVDGDLLAADWEDPGVSCADKDTFLAEVKRLRPTHRTVLYCNVSFWTSRDTTSNCGDGLWIADPSHPAGSPNVQHEWAFQQYSSTGGVDRNVANPDLFKDAAALKAWATGTEPPVAHDALTAADVKTIVTTDNLLAAPTGIAAQADSKTNKFYTWTTHVQLQTQNAIEANLRIQDVAKQIDALSTTGLTDAQVQQIATAVGGNAALVNAIAEAVAEKIAARLQS